MILSSSALLTLAACSAFQEACRKARHGSTSCPNKSEPLPLPHAEVSIHTFRNHETQFVTRHDETTESLGSKCAEATDDARISRTVKTYPHGVHPNVPKLMPGSPCSTQRHGATLLALLGRLHLLMAEPVNGLKMG